MKTTVKDFILNNMTDVHFERLVNMLVIENERIYYSEMADTITEYVNKQESSYKKNNTFEIVNQIKMLTEQNLIEFLVPTTNDLNDSRPLEALLTHRLAKKSKDVDPIIETPNVSITVNSSNDLEPELDISDIDLEPELHCEPQNVKDLKAKPIYFTDIKFAFLSNKKEDNDSHYIKANEVNMMNYQEYVSQQKKRVALGLSNFIYEMLHFNSEYKLMNDFKSFSHEESHVKIVNNDSVDDPIYDVHILVDNRTRYIPKNELKYYYDETGIEFSEEPPAFIEYDHLQEDVTMGMHHYILEPFVCYLNEGITIPNLSEKELYDLLEQFIHLFTHHGFTKDEQIESIRYFDKEYRIIV
ncbi:hypothetical protein [Bacillus sp. JCM 19034]|uniref:hypothetical protein n=1 Tax=Bacillus sp. JCM 19034 TaxID=1481928 RepID=UPI00078569C9|nr:hypothetical protein [Bacillus sp. JCM 19034]